jgi:hypothetical protein
MTPPLEIPAGWFCAHGTALVGVRASRSVSFHAINMNPQETIIDGPEGNEQFQKGNQFNE